MTGVRVKICGLNDAETLGAAIDAGTDMVGFVFYAPSPRHLSHDAARALARRVPAGIDKVALTVDATDEELAAIVDAVAPDYIQAHGSETPERIAHVARHFGVPVIKAIKVSDAADIEAAAAYDGIAHMLLFDARAPEHLDRSLPGGNGVAFDWSLMNRVPRRTVFMLSGGLDERNVREAIRIARPPIVDVSSGVERAPGRKDPAAIRRFIAVAKGLELAGDNAGIEAERPTSS